LCNFVGDAHCACLWELEFLLGELQSDHFCAGTGSLSTLRVLSCGYSNKVVSVSGGTTTTTKVILPE
jgi:hypothetical protein